MKVLARLWNAVIGASLLLTLPQACATQNEGERCSILNGDADCDDGLRCMNADFVGALYAVCCYPLGSSSGTNTSAPCLQNSSAGAGGTGGTPNTADAAGDAPDGGDADTGTAE